MKKNKKHRTQEYRYRRRNMDEQRKSKSFGHVMQQTIVSILLFVVVLSLWMNQDETVGFAKSSIRYIVTENTDWKGSVSEFCEQVLSAVTQNKKTNAQFEPLADLAIPAEGKMISSFGKRTKRGTTEEEFHYGVDFEASSGNKIFCCADGIVAEIGESETYGKYILVSHNEKLSSYYGGCGEILPQEGTKVTKGQLLGTISGNSEQDTACLHFEIREGDTSLDPAAFLNTLQKG